MQDITNDAKKLLLALYKVYLDKRSSGISRSASAMIGNSDEIQESLFKQEPAEDIADLCWELKRAGYVVCCSGDDIANEVTIMPETIIAMEKRFPDGVKQVVDALLKIAGIVASFV